MTLTHFCGAVALFLFACASYYRGRFLIALALELLALAGFTLLARELFGNAAWISLLPALFLLLHLADARFGLFLLPTVYAIPFALLFTIALLVACGIALLCRPFS